MSDAMKLNIGQALEEERQWRDTRSKTKGRRVKIEKVNQAWLVRFLPVALGKKGLFYIRQGQHWLNKSPIFCPRDVATDFGGNPDAECPVCALSEELNNMPDEKVSKFGFSIRSNISYVTYCVVYEIDYGRGDNEVMSPADILRPWEFDHYQGSFDELTDYFRRGASAKRPWSVLDLEHGNDFWATKTTKGIRLDRQDPRPILEIDENFEANLDTIFNGIQQPRIIIPTMKDLEVFARKAEDAAFAGDKDDGGHRGGSSRGGSRSSHGVEEGDDPQGGADDDRPSRRMGRGTSTSSRRMARAVAPEPEPEGAGAEEQNSDAPQDGGGEDQVPGAEVPAPARRPAAAPAAARPAARPAAPAAAPAAARPAARPAAAPAAARPAAAPARPAAAPARPAPAAAATRPAAAAAPAARPAAARPAAASVTTGARRPAPAAAAPAARRTAEPNVDEHEDPGVAEEAQDQAGPAGEPLPEEGAQNGEPAAAEGDPAGDPAGEPGQEGEPGAAEGAAEEPPPAPAPRTGGSSLRGRLMNKLQNR